MTVTERELPGIRERTYEEMGIETFLSLTYKSLAPIRHCVSMTSYLFSLLMVTTHAFHPMSLWSNLLHHSKLLIAPSGIFGTSFLYH